MPYVMNSYLIQIPVGNLFKSLLDNSMNYMTKPEV